mmetsp:Transcript_70108/g.181782  ORF Transcript_70108/g.181782 Transcript_70108/m.181782 type:complete len:87 (+) Transcript_70108:1512-1772(+)
MRRHFGMEPLHQAKQAHPISRRICSNLKATAPRTVLRDNFLFHACGIFRARAPLGAESRTTELLRPAPCIEGTGRCGHAFDQRRER